MRDSKMKFPAFLIVSMSLLAGCTSKHDPSAAASSAQPVRLIASTDLGTAAAVAADWPQVGILIHAEGPANWSQCTVTLIDPHTVLGAAHCVTAPNLTTGGIDTLPEDSLWVSFNYVEPPAGQHPLNNLAVDFVAIRKVFVPPSYTGTNNPGMDIALLLLAEEQHFPTLALWRGEGSVFFPDAQASVAGYGDDGSGGMGVKLAGTVSLGEFQNASGLISVSKGPSGAIPCVGDSGGPLIISPYLMGVLSTVNNAECSKVTEASFTNANAPKTLAWLEETLFQADTAPGGCAVQDSNFNETLAGCMHSASGLVLSGMAPRQLSLAKARSYCRSLIEGTYSGWRLPSPDELVVAASAAKVNLRLGQQDAYWSDGPTDESGLNLAVRFMDGGRQRAVGAEPHVVLCVRDGT